MDRTIFFWWPRLGPPSKKLKYPIYQLTNILLQSLNISRISGGAHSKTCPSVWMSNWRRIEGCWTMMDWCFPIKMDDFTQLYLPCVWDWWRLVWVFVKGGIALNACVVQLARVYGASFTRMFCWFRETTWFSWVLNYPGVIRHFWLWETEAAEKKLKCGKRDRTYTSNVSFIYWNTRLYHFETQ